MRKAFKVDNYPQIFFFRDGVLIEKYEGERKKEHLTEYATKVMELTYYIINFNEVDRVVRKKSLFTNYILFGYDLSNPFFDIAKKLFNVHSRFFFVDLTNTTYEQAISVLPASHSSLSSSFSPSFTDKNFFFILSVFEGKAYNVISSVGITSILSTDSQRPLLATAIEFFINDTIFPPGYVYTYPYRQHNIDNNKNFYLLRSSLSPHTPGGNGYATNATLLAEKSKKKRYALDANNHKKRSLLLLYEEDIAEQEVEIRKQRDTRLASKRGRVAVRDANFFAFNALANSVFVNLARKNAAGKDYHAIVNRMYAAPTAAASTAGSSNGRGGGSNLEDDIATTNFVYFGLLNGTGSDITEFFGIRDEHVPTYFVFDDDTRETFSFSTAAEDAWRAAWWDAERQRICTVPGYRFTFRNIIQANAPEYTDIVDRYSITAETLLPSPCAAATAASPASSSGSSGSSDSSSSSSTSTATPTPYATLPLSALLAANALTQPFLTHFLSDTLAHLLVRVKAGDVPPLTISTPAREVMEEFFTKHYIGILIGVVVFFVGMVALLVVSVCVADSRARSLAVAGTGTGTGTVTGTGTGAVRVPEGDRAALYRGAYRGRGEQKKVVVADGEKVEDEDEKQKRNGMPGRSEKQEKKNEEEENGNDVEKEEKKKKTKKKEIKKDK